MSDWTEIRYHEHEPINGHGYYDDPNNYADIDLLERLRRNNTQDWQTLKVQAIMEIERLRKIVGTDDKLQEIEHLRNVIIRLELEIDELKWERYGDNL